MKRRVPVSERIISKVFANKELTGSVEAKRTAFYDKAGNLIAELEETFHIASPYGLKGWYLYMDQYISEDVMNE